MADPVKWSDVKVDAELAEKLVRGWLSRSECAEVLPQDRSVPFYSFKDSIRTFIAKTNKLANNALWDDKPNTAMRLLMKYGLGDDVKRIEKPNVTYDRKLLAASTLARKGYSEWKEATGRMGANSRRKRIR